MLFIKGHIPKLREGDARYTTGKFSLCKMGICTIFTFPLVFLRLVASVDHTAGAQLEVKSREDSHL